MKRFVLALCLGGLAGWAGCGSSPFYSCDFRQGSPPQQKCEEYVGLSDSDLNTQMMLCTNLGAKFANQACAHGTLGGCTQSMGGITLTGWFYSDSAAGITTSANVMAFCSGHGTTYIAP